MFRQITALLALTCAAAAQDLRFEAAVVKPHPHPPTPEEYMDALRRGETSLQPGCRVGPGTLQLSCAGGISLLLQRALEISPVQINRPASPYYTLVAKLPRPSTWPQINAMLLKFMQERMGVVFHTESRTLKGYFLRVEDMALLNGLSRSTRQAIVEESISYRRGGSDSYDALYDEVVSPHLPNEPYERHIKCHDISFAELAGLLYRSYSYGSEPAFLDVTGQSFRFSIEFSVKYAGTDAPGPATNLLEIVRLLRAYGVALRQETAPAPFVVVDKQGDPSTFVN